MKTNHTGKLNSYLFKKTEVYAFPLSADCTGHAWAFFNLAAQCIHDLEVSYCDCFHGRNLDFERCE